MEKKEAREERIAAKKRMDENREAQAMNAEVAMMLVCPWVAYCFRGLREAGCL